MTTKTKRDPIRSREYVKFARENDRIAVWFNSAVKKFEVEDWSTNDTRANRYNTFEEAWAKVDEILHERRRQEINRILAEALG